MNHNIRSKKYTNGVNFQSNEGLLNNRSIAVIANVSSPFQCFLAYSFKCKEFRITKKKKKTKFTSLISSHSTNKTLFVNNAKTKTDNNA
jgi:hypothetical protein